LAVSIFFIAAKIPQISHSVTPYALAESIETGSYAVENLGNKRAVILKHHGVAVVGRDLN
jgi:ribulose-5-phosphate 4-epimerase/fuculose-1-phosphate aldolase